MASEYYGVNRGTLSGAFPGNVTVGTSTGSTDIELRVDLTKGSTKLDVINALDSIRNYILSQGGALGLANVPIL